MSLGSILGQLVQNGLGGGAPTERRVQSARQHLGNGNLNGIFGQVQDALARSGRSGDSARRSASGSGFAEGAGSWLGRDQIGGLTGAQVGGIGAVAGALFGGGLRGAAQGGALAVLGTLALGALRNAQAERAAAAGGTVPASLPAPEEAETVVAPEMERLVLRAMLSAAKADGQIDQSELANVFSKLGTESVTGEEKQFLMEELGRPADLEALAAEVRTPAQAAEIYAASLLAIHVDTDAERAYLAELAAALGLDSATVAELHRMTGADS